MNYSKTKSTKRFSFDITRNSTAHKAGGNALTISTLPSDDSGYSIGQTSLTMTVREAQALQGFLNEQFVGIEANSVSDVEYDAAVV